MALMSRNVNNVVQLWIRCRSAGSKYVLVGNLDLFIAAGQNHADTADKITSPFIQMSIYLFLCLLLEQIPSDSGPGGGMKE